MANVSIPNALNDFDSKEPEPGQLANGLMNTHVIKDILASQSWIKDSEIFKMMFDNIPVLIGVYTTSRYLYVNSTFKQILGYTFEDLQQMNFWDIVHEEDREMVKARGLARHRGEPVPLNYEFRALKKNGEAIWLNLFFAVANIGGDNISIGVSFDVTESKQLKAELQAAHDELEMRVRQRTEELDRINQELIFTNQNLNNVLRNMSYGVVTVNRSGDFDILNSIFSPATDKTINEIKSKLKDLYNRGEMAFVNKMINENESFRDQEIKLIASDEGPLYFLASGTPILNEAGAVNKGVIMLRPIKEIHKLVNRYSGFQATFHFEDIITADQTMLDLIKSARNAAFTKSNILIQGGSGTGKELFVQAIHNESLRNKGPFLAVNCGAIPRELIGSELFGYAEGAFTSARKGGNPGKFELANGGTLFLDEIGDMPFEQQSALLRVIQEKNITRIGGRDVIPIDVRIICATNKDLSMEMNRGNFRQDLYYRLNIVNIKIPPLRERPLDIILLFRHFIQTTASQFDKTINDIHPDVLNCLSKYHWPGNVRELQNVVERMLNILSGSTLEMEYLPPEIRESLDIERTSLPTAHRTYAGITIREARALKQKTIADLERNQIISLMDKYHGNVKKIAQEMGISRTTLYKKMHYYSM